MRVREISCEYQPYIFQPSGVRNTRDLYHKAASNDEATIDNWSKTWIENTRHNHKKHGPFASKALGQIFGKYLHRPVICAGSGPSLKYNYEHLRDRKGIPLISCLHNFQFFTDNGIEPEYYVSLDAGIVTVEEVSEGGKESPDFYWEKTKGKTLLAFIGSHPDLIDRWQGDVLFYNAPIPDKATQDGIREIEVFNQLVSNGGNVLGSCLYIAKAWMGAGAIIFVGADFSFGYDRKFHAWGSKYDRSMGRYQSAVDVFGNKVATWPSYNNFKSFFDYVALEVPGTYINCTEGGTLGAYPEGNLHAIKVMDLKDCLQMYSMSEFLKPVVQNPAIEGDEGRRILY